jgi:hypothetical protein
LKNWRTIKSQVVGDTSEFAVEWGLSEAFAQPGQWAIGYFVIYIKGKCFGVKTADATLLGCSFDELGDRLKRRGAHVAAISAYESSELVRVVKSIIYLETHTSSRFFGLSVEDWMAVLYEKYVLWAPDGDEAFDDGSHILHFDIDDHVRLIGFVNMETIEQTLQTIEDVTVEAQNFYSVLEQCIDSISQARDELLNNPQN